MRFEARSSLCPSRFCCAHNPVQALVSRFLADQVKERALEGAIHCSSCGCVWVRDDLGKAHVLGTLRKTGQLYEWKSLYKPAPTAG